MAIVYFDSISALGVFSGLFKKYIEGVFKFFFYYYIYLLIDGCTIDVSLQYLVTLRIKNKDKRNLLLFFLFV